MEGLLRMLRKKEAPFTGNTLEDELALILEVHAGSSDQVLDGARNDDLARVGLGDDPCADMHSNPADFFSHNFTLAGM